MIREEIETISTDIPQSLELDLTPQPAGIEDLQQSVDMSYASMQKEKREFKKIFLSAYSSFKQMTPRPTNKPKEVRLGPTDTLTKVTSEIARKLITDIGYQIQEEIMPGQPGAKTGKSTTYLVSKDSMSTPFSVVFGSANKGESFEAALHADLVAGSGPLGDELLSALGLTRADILSVEDPLPARKRPLTSTIRDDGQAISDITLNTPTRKIYISLKDPQGTTFANTGYAGGFIESEEGRVSPGSHPLDDFISALGIDKNKVAQGVNDYKFKKISDPSQCSIENSKSFDGQKITDYLAAALGYGYVYARKKRKGGYHIEDIKTADDAYAIIGVPTSVNIIYARYCGDSRNQSSKGTRAVVDTDNGARYDVAIRNKSGGITPKEIAVSIKAYPIGLSESSNRLKIYDFIFSD